MVAPMQGTARSFGPLRTQAPRLGAALALAMFVLLTGCASGPQRASSPTAALPSSSVEKAEPGSATELIRMPDAEPRVEPIRSGGPNKPYDVLGKSYVPITQDGAYSERGVASWYGPRFHGRRTASGEVYNQYAMTAAHPTLPIPSYARIRNPANGREVVVRINDRGPFHGGRIVDLSYTAALKLDLHRGIGKVELQRITFDEIRTGAWRRGTEADAVRLAAGEASTTPAPTAASPSPSTSTSTPTPTPTSTSTSTPTPAVVVQAADTVPVVALVTALPATAPTAVASAPAEPVADAPAARALTAPARGFWVQLGAFKAREGAEGFHRRVSTELDWLAPLLAVFQDSAIYRLQAGPYPSRDEARGVAERARSGLQLVPVIVERR
jgi:rare lipoprotein A